MRCDECQIAMLDELYGLLEPAESAALAAHVATCPECEAEYARAKGQQEQIQKASTLSFPALQFTAPAEQPTVPSESAQPRRLTTRDHWLRWVVAAAILLAVSGTFGPTFRKASFYLEKSSQIESVMQKQDRLAAQYEGTKAEYEAAMARDVKKLDDAKKQYGNVLQEWVTARQKAESALPFAVTVRGPAAAIPGAPNDYAIAAVNDRDAIVSANVVATLVGKNGKEYFRTTTETAAGRETPLRIPASAWLGVGAKEPLSLRILATNPVTKQTSELNEPLRMMDAAYSTVLATDALLYRPGDTIRFRSLTLDRTRFEPPSRDLRLAYALIGPDKQIVPGLALSGTTHLESAAGKSSPIQPVLGPDGNAVRGIGCGEIAIPSKLANGLYQLAVYELPEGWTASIPPPQTAPLATRPIRIQSYTVHKWHKTLTFDKLTYGPGEAVIAKLTVSNQGQPVANANLMIDATADNLPVISLDHPPVTDRAGQATIRFTLPKKAEIQQAVLRVTVLNEAMSESIIRPIPLVSRSMTVEFFPEGGDLVAGVPNRVYVRGRLPNGKPADFAGTITDGNNAVATVQSEADADAPGANRGIGVFTFTPHAGTTYTLNLSRPIGLTTMTATLPSAKADGVVLSIPQGVVANGEPIVVNLVSTKPRKLVVGAYSRGTPVAHAAVTIEAGVPTPVTMTPDAAAPGGVTRVTVFEEPADAAPGRKELRPVAERLMYRAESKRLNLSINSESGETFAPSNGVAVPANDRQTFLPGQSVSFDIVSKNERGEPVPAIVYVAIANEMLYGQVDDQTERSLPTHFLLNGEVQNPDSLERADFLLGKEPNARRALDRLLGTQGWRRFAEQNPSEFRKTAKPDDADRLLLAVGSRSPVPSDFKPSVQRVNELFVPRYEAALAALETAEAERETNKRAGKEAEQFSLVLSALEGPRQEIGELSKQIHTVDRPIDSETTWMAMAIGLTVVSLALLLVRFTIARSIPERGLLLWAGLVMLALAGISIATNAYVTIQFEQMLKATKARISAIPQTVNDPAKSNPSTRSVKTSDPKPFPALEGNDGKMVQFSATPNPMDLGSGIVLEADRIAEGRRFVNELDGVRNLRKIRHNERTSRIVEAAQGTEKIAASLAAQPPFFVREYSHKHVSQMTQTDYTEVLYWNPVIVLPGDAVPHSVSFQPSDLIANYRVTVAGHTLDGRLGQTVAHFKVKKALVASVKFPPEISWGDKVDLVATVQSAESSPKTNLYVRGDNAIVRTTNEIENTPVQFNAEGLARRVVRWEPNAPGPKQVTVTAVDQDHRRRDVSHRSIDVVPSGYSASGSASTILDRTAAFTVAVPKDRVDRSLELSIKAYANPLAELEASIVGMAQGPARCFEQSAARAYPNVLMLQWLESHGRNEPGTASLALQARNELPGGYRSLLDFECEKPGSTVREGFEWFGGKARPHEALTAYGLLHFNDLKHVYAVDPAVIDRTKRFLLSRRDGQGGFLQSDDARDTFGRAPADVANAYITWALRETDPGINLKVECDAVAREAVKSGDPYRLALAAMTATSKADAKPLLDLLRGKQTERGDVAGAATSITRSAGQDLIVETTSLAILAWLKHGDEYSANVRKGLMYLMGHRQAGGGFGATQATVMALKAITESTRSLSKIPETARLALSVNGKPRGVVSVKDGRLFSAAEIDDWFVTGSAEIELKSMLDHAIPVAVEWKCRTKSPPRSEPSELEFNASLDATTVREGGFVKLNVSLKRIPGQDPGMVMTSIGLPAGLTVPTDAKQLIALTDRASHGDPVPAFWELRGRDLVLYWRSLPASTPSSFSLDLAAEYPGEYRGSGNRAYPYYHPQAAVDRAPLEITVFPK